MRQTHSLSHNDASGYYPASYDLPNVIAVAATDGADKLAAWSNRGASRVHIAAPGVRLLTTAKGGYEVESETPRLGGSAGGGLCTVEGFGVGCRQASVFAGLAGLWDLGGSAGIAGPGGDTDGYRHSHIAFYPHYTGNPETGTRTDPRDIFCAYPGWSWGLNQGTDGWR